MTHSNNSTPENDIQATVGASLQDLVSLELSRLFAPPDLLQAGAYESPLERLFAHHAVKYFRRGLELQTQVQVATPIGRFRLDFVIATPTSRVGIECDGAEFHYSLDAWARDKERDRAILAAGSLDVIVRIPGKSLVFHPEDCFYVLLNWNPELFSDRGAANLARLASRECRAAIDTEPNVVNFRYRHDADDADARDITWFDIERRHA